MSAQWSAEETYVSAERKQKTGKAILRKESQFVGEIGTRFAKEIVNVMNTAKRVKA